MCLLAWRCLILQCVHAARLCAGQSCHKRGVDPALHIFVFCVLVGCWEIANIPPTPMPAAKLMSVRHAHLIFFACRKAIQSRQLQHHLQQQNSQAAPAPPSANGHAEHVECDAGFPEDAQDLHPTVAKVWRVLGVGRAWVMGYVGCGSAVKRTCIHQ